MQLCVIPGDGIGHEVIPVAVSALRRLVPGLQTHAADAGWECFQRSGSSVPEATLESLRATGAGLFGAVSSPARKVAGYRSAILTLRQQLGLNCNLRPVRSWPVISPRSGVDMLIMRENSEGLYVGREHMESEGIAIAELQISRAACEQFAARIVEVAEQRGAHRVTLAHKANVLPLTCGLFRDTCRQVLAVHGWEAQVDERLVDVAALQLVESPESFDVLATTNLFGDILSDLACHWSGGLGMAPSLNWGQGITLAEPVHGSAPDIVGTGRANPIAALLSAALLLRYHWQQPELAARLDAAVEGFLVEAGAVDFADRTTEIIADGVISRL